MTSSASIASELIEPRKISTGDFLYKGRADWRDIDHIAHKYVDRTLMLSQYCFWQTFIDDPEDKEQQIQELSQSEIHGGFGRQPRTNGGLEFSRKGPETYPLRDADRLVHEFIIKRKLGDQNGDLTFQNNSEIVLYNRENTPGYFKRRNWHWTLTHLGEYSSDVYTVPLEEVPEQRLPMVYILGVPYCGSITLFEFLKMHPYIIGVHSDVRYFDLDENLFKGLDWFKSQMPLSFNNQVIVDANPSYFWDHRAPRKIHKINKKMKLILILRDPVQTIMSLAASMGTGTDDLTVSVRGMMTINSRSSVINSGIYVKYIKTWLEYFPLKQFHVIEYKDLISRPATLFYTLEDFLGIPHKITTSNFLYNETLVGYCARPFHTQTVMCPRTEQTRIKLPLFEESLLYTFYRSYNDELFTVLGQHFDWPTSPNYRTVESNGLIHN